MSQKNFVGNLSGATKMRKINSVLLIANPVAQIISVLPTSNSPKDSLSPPRDLHFSLIFASLPLKIVHHGLFKFAISSIVTITAVYLSLVSSKFHFRSNRSGDCESLSNPAKHGSPNFGAELHLALYILLVDSLLHTSKFLFLSDCAIKVGICCSPLHLGAQIVCCSLKLKYNVLGVNLSCSLSFSMNMLVWLVCASLIPSNAFLFRRPIPLSLISGLSSRTSRGSMCPWWL